MHQPAKGSDETHNQLFQSKSPPLGIKSHTQELKDDNISHSTDQTCLKYYYQQNKQASSHKNKKHKLPAEEFQEKQSKCRSCKEEFLRQMEITPAIHKWLSIPVKPNKRWGTISPYKKPARVFRFGHQNVDGITFCKVVLTLALHFTRRGKSVVTLSLLLK